jgi:hypothetical protein
MSANSPESLPYRQSGPSMAPARPLSVLSVVLPTGLPSRLSGMRLGLAAIRGMIEAHDPWARVRVFHVNEDAPPDPGDLDVVVFSLSNPLEFRLVFDFCRVAAIPRRARSRGPGLPLFVGGHARWFGQRSSARCKGPARAFR